MKKIKLISRSLLAAILLFYSCCGVSLSQSFTETNPKWMHHWWLEVTGGYSDFAFTNANLQPGFHAGEINTTSISFRGALGYNLTRYLAIDLSLMRGVDWVQYNNMTPPVGNNCHTVWNSLFGLSLRPFLPLGQYVGIYGEGGLAYISRHGFTLDDVTAVSNKTLVSALFGGGLLFNVWQDLFIDLNAIYALPNSSQQQPETWYAGLGIFYLIGSSSLSTDESNSNYFPKNFIVAEYMNKGIFYVNAADAIYLPIFFTSSLFVKEGLSVRYERNIFHTSKYFSLDLGASYGYWVSSQYAQSFSTVTFFPEIKIWLWRSSRADLYFTYSLAGPTLISRYEIDKHLTGTNFTFQDFLGVGVFLGKKKHFNLNLQLMHFSNGNLFPDNPGVDVPLMVGIGYAFD